MRNHLHRDSHAKVVVIQQVYNVGIKVGHILKASGFYIGNVVTGRTQYKIRRISGCDSRRKLLIKSRPWHGIHLNRNVVFIAFIEIIDNLLQNVSVRAGKTIPEGKCHRLIAAGL